MAQIKTMMNMHAKRYIAMVFEETLRTEGFACPDNKYLCWYRLRNNEILDTIIFCTNDSNIPMIMDIQFEATPLFFCPILTKSVSYNRNTHDRWDCIKRIPIYELVDGGRSVMSPYSSEIQVYAPTRGKRGRYVLTEVILPYFRRNTTLNDCYLCHKKVHLDIDPRYKSQMFFNMSLDFVSEVIFNNDAALFPHCQDRAIRAIHMYQNLIAKKPNHQQLKTILQHWEQVYAVLVNDGREEYLADLEQRKIGNIAYFQKMLHFSF